MKLSARRFHATFSATQNEWTVNLEEIIFKVEYIKIEGYKTKRALKTTIQEIAGEEVELEFLRNCITIKKWKKLEKRHFYELYNPDKPRGLAKTVTVR